MFGRWTFGGRLAAGFAFAGLVLVAVGIAGYYSIVRLIENGKWVSHTNEVRRELASLLTHVHQAQTGQRGFIITGADRFLEPYRVAEQKVAETHERLRVLTLDNPAQQERLRELAPLITRRKQHLLRVIDERQRGFEPAAATIASGEGEELMDAIRGVAAVMDRHEQELLKTRVADAEETAEAARSVILWGALVGPIAVAFLGWYLIDSLGRQVGETVERLQGSSNQLQTAATQQTAVARQQAAAMDAIATTIRELVATARQIADGARRVAGVAATTAHGAAGGDRTVQRTERAVSEGRGQVDAIVDRMIDLRRKSQQVDVILEFINDLTEQTNVLAINASIEAAGAGEYGRRFGVVADEIRKLADRVGGSAKDVRALLDDIRAAIQATVVATEKGSSAVQDGTRQFHEASAAFQEIVRLVATTTEAAREIELSTQQQTTAVEQVNEAIAEVAQASRESEIASRQTLEAATELAGVARDLTAFVQPRA